MSRRVKKVFFIMIFPTRSNKITIKRLALTHSFILLICIKRTPVRSAVNITYPPKTCAVATAQRNTPDANARGVGLSLMITSARSSFWFLSLLPFGYGRGRYQKRIHLKSKERSAHPRFGVRRTEFGHTGRGC